MLKDYLASEEQDALEAICRHHGVDNPDLVKDLARMLNWTRAHERDKIKFGRTPEAPFLIVLLSQMGIYGDAALKPARKDPPEATA